MLTAGIIAPMTRTWRLLISFFAIALLGLGLAACGGDDDDATVASDNGGKTTTTAKADDAMDDSSTTMAGDDSGGGDDQMMENPCAPGGDGKMPGGEMESMAPADDAT